MFELRVRSSFAAAHHLNGYPGKCQRLHGHTWEVEAVVTGRDLDATGMLVDFSLLKDELARVLEPFDHAYLNDLAPFSDVQAEQNPTAENIARYLFYALKARLAEKQVKITLSRVTVWESPTAAASYREAD